MDKKDIPDRREGSGGEGGSRTKLDLSLAQVLGSAVAAVVAAFAAGQLGVYGTFLGAGVVSLVATSGGPIFQHLFRRTGEQIKEVTVPPRARQGPVRDPAAGWKDGAQLDTAIAADAADAAGSGDSGGPTRAVPGPGGRRGDEDGTRLLPTAGSRGHRDGTDDDATRMLRAADAGAGTDERTRMLRTVGATGAPDERTRMLRKAEGDDPAQRTQLLRTVGGEEKLPGDGEFGASTTHGTKWRGWKRTLLPALLVFVIAVGGITVYEVISGHNVSGGKGTSISDVFRSGGGSSQDEGPDRVPGESGTPSPGSSDDGGAGEDGSGSPSADPDTGNGQQGGESGSGEKGGATQSPDPGTSQQPGGEQGGTGTHSPDTGNGDGSDGSGDDGSGQDGPGDAPTSGSDQGGAGSGRMPQQQQPDTTPAG